MSSILLLEDEVSQLSALEEFFRDFFADTISQAASKAAKTEAIPKPQVYSAERGQEARKILQERHIDLLITDLMLPDCTGLEILEEVRAQDYRTDILILTGQPTIESAVLAIRKGADDYLVKPIDFNLLANKVHHLLERRRLLKENQDLKERLKIQLIQSNVIGSSPLMDDFFARLRQIAPTAVSVLLEGESGSGKEMIAKLIHEGSPRSNALFVTVNCGALTKNLLESELFGAVKGAYTGAQADRSGYFQTAHGGTIFLDEIGEMDLESQVRLLRVLEERRVNPVGSSKAIAVDVRVIAATNKKLLEEVEKGSFREDLYYRLSVIKLRLPPLRERKEDIPLLLHHFLVHFNEKYGKSVRAMSPKLSAFFQEYPWPGNVRELRNIIEAMVLLAAEDVLEWKDLPTELQNPREHRAAHKSLLRNIAPCFSFAEYEKAIITTNLKFFQNNKAKTAVSLGIAERTLYRKLKEYHIQ